MMPSSRNTPPPGNVLLHVPTTRFVGGIEFDGATGELRRDGTVVRLEPQPSAVLAELVARAGELLSHGELRRAVWGDATHVKVPDALHYCVRQIRSALGDTARQPRYIETIPRRGYRLRAACLLPDAAPAVPDSSAPVGRVRPVVWRWGVRFAVAGALAMAVIAVEQRPNDHHEIAVTVLRSVHNLIF